MKMTRRLLTSAIAGVLLFVGVAPASAAPKIIEQSAVLELSPKDLRFDDMVIGVPQTQTVTVKNISGRTLNINPSIKLSSGYSSFLSSSMIACSDSGRDCIDANVDASLLLAVNESYDLHVTLTLTDELPEALNGVPLEGGIEVRGEVLAENPEDETIVIVPDEVAKDIPEEDKATSTFDPKDGLASTGVQYLTFILLGVGSVTLALGFLLFAYSKRRKSSTVQE